MWSVYSFFAQLIIQFNVVERRLITVIYTDAISLSTVYLPRVSKVMSAFVTYSYFEWRTPQVNGCVDCALFNAVLNV